MCICNSEPHFFYIFHTMNCLSIFIIKFLRFKGIRHRKNVTRDFNGKDVFFKQILTTAFVKSIQTSEHWKSRIFHHLNLPKKDTLHPSMHVPQQGTKCSCGEQ